MVSESEEDNVLMEGVDVLPIVIGGDNEWPTAMEPR